MRFQICALYTFWPQEHNTGVTDLGQLRVLLSQIFCLQQQPKSNAQATVEEQGRQTSCFTLCVFTVNLQRSLLVRCSFFLFANH